MKGGRKRTFPAIARLSRTAREIMEAAFMEGPGVRSVQSIIDQIRKETREKVDDNAVHRYREYWSSEERPWIEARQEADAMFTALKQNPTADFEELVKQRLTVAQILSAKRLEGADPVELGYLAQGEKRIELEKKKLEINKQRTELMRERVKVLQGQLKLREKQIVDMRRKAEKAVEKVRGAAKAAGMGSKKVAEMVDAILGLSAT